MEPIFLVAELLNKEVKKTRSWHGLQKAIEKTAASLSSTSRGQHGPSAHCRSIHRRKLQRIAEGSLNVPLNVSELLLLNAHFTKDGGAGLWDRPIFSRTRNLLHEITDSEKVTFFLGARYVEAFGIEMISRWDVIAASCIRDPIANRVTSETIDVATRSLTKPMSVAEWSQLQRQVTGNTYVSIGSPVASASSEFLLADMFNVPPYRSQRQLPPVCFVRDQQDYDSAFIVPSGAIDECRSPGLIIGGEVIRAPDAHTEHALVVGQRRSASTTVFAVCGCSGPGTSAAAACLASGQIQHTLPAFRRRKYQPVSVVIIATNIASIDDDRRIDRRSVAESHVERIQVFTYTHKRWSCSTI